MFSLNSKVLGVILLLLLVTLNLKILVKFDYVLQIEFIKPSKERIFKLFLHKLQNENLTITPPKLVTILENNILNQ